MPETENDELELGEDNNEPSLLVTVDDSIARINLVSMVIPEELRQHCMLITIYR